MYPSSALAFLFDPFTLLMESQALISISNTQGKETSCSITGVLADYEYPSSIDQSVWFSKWVEATLHLLQLAVPDGYLLIEQHTTIIQVPH